MNFTYFKSLASYLNSVPNINRGGCGYSAYFIYNYLKAHESELAKPEIVFMYEYGSPRYSENSDALAGKADPVSCAHVVVKFNDAYYDSEGCHDEDHFGFWHFHVVPEEFLLKALKNRHEWNKMFNRDLYVPKMEKKIGVCLPKS